MRDMSSIYDCEGNITVTLDGNNAHVQIDYYKEDLESETFMLTPITKQKLSQYN